jgi:hypothetical protein
MGRKDAQSNQNGFVREPGGVRRAPPNRRRTYPDNLDLAESAHGPKDLLKGLLVHVRTQVAHVPALEERRVCFNDLKESNAPLPCLTHKGDLVTPFQSLLITYSMVVVGGGLSPS